ncbi:hypothetical protein D6C83_00383, partial [Aureobasidium pullulans]
LGVRDAKIFDYRHYLEQAAFTDRVAGLQRASANMWNIGRSRPDLKIIAQELILLALGHRSPASYQRTVQDSTVTEAGLTLVTEEVEGLKTSDSTWRCREFAYYKWLQELRVAGCEYVDLAQVKRTRTVFAQFQGPKTRAHVLEWAKFFKPFAGLLAKRALGDHTDKAEHGIISRDTRGFQPINEWHNYNSFWRSVGDSARFNTTHVQLDRGWLPRANIQLEHGFEGVASENAVWSIWPRWIEGALVLCASVHLPAHSFVGILPGRPGFIAEEVPAGVVEGPEPGLYMELGSRVGLLSTISRTKTYAEGNVIVTWEPYADEMSSGHTCFHLVLFTYRAIELCQPLVPWDHMTKCHVEGGQVTEANSGRLPTHNSSLSGSDTKQHHISCKIYCQGEKHASRFYSSCPSCCEPRKTMKEH